MKNLSKLSLSFILLFSSFSISFAQIDDDFETLDDVEIVEVEDGRTSAPEAEPSVEQDELEEESAEEQIIVPEKSFWTVLGAILIPSFFIILVYFILKFFKF